MAKLAILFGVFLVISIAHGFLFPKNYEITYKYEALMKLSIEKPTLFTSELLTDAKLTLKTHENQIFAVLHDIDYSMYNGKGSRVGIDTKIVQIPPEAKSLSLPFTIEYQKSGKVIGIKTDDNDQPWSINIKKAIASALQLDVEQVLQGKYIYAFRSEEPTVHGMCKVLYSVMRKEDSRFVIKKHHSPTLCKGFKWETNFNVHSGPCNDDFENPLTLSTDRRYEVVKKDDSFFLDQVQTINTVIMAPYRSNSDSYYLLANQTLSVLKVEELKSAMPEDVAKNTHDLKIKFYGQDSDKGYAYDVTGGRGNYDNTVLLESAKTGLNNLIHQLDDTQSHFTNSNELPEKASMVLLKLRMLNEKQIDALYVDSTKDLLLQMLPHVGTRASHLLLIKIISDENFSSEMAIKLLQEVHFFIQNPDSRLVKELMTLCDKETVPEVVKNAVKIAASNMISFILEKYPDDKVAHSYVDSFIEKFSKAVEYTDKLTYLSALANIKARKSVKFLEHVIKNDVEDIKVSDHFRALAIWGIKNEYVKYTEYFDKIYWPLLEDKNEDTEVRVAALSTLMDNPSVHNLLKVHTFMETERDEEIFNVYYTILKSISKSKQLCNKEIALNARKILSITKKKESESSISFTYLTDYLDSVYGFGESFKVSVVRDSKNDKYLSLYIQYSPQASNINLNYKALYIHFSAEEDKTLTDKFTLSNKTFTYYGNLADWVMSDEVQNSTKIEFVSLNNGQVTSFSVLDVDDWDDILQYFDPRLLTKSNNKANYDLEQMIAGKSTIATDLGIPVDAYFKTPSTKRFKYYLSPILLGFVNFDMKYVMSNNQIYGLGFYNPLVDVHHGVERSHVQKMYFPFEIDLSGGFGTFELTFNHSSNDIIESFGLQTSVSSQTYIVDIENNVNKLKSTCAKCENFTVVSKGKEHQKQVTVSEENLDYLGFLLKLEFFDCEIDVSDVKLSELFERISSEDNQNFGDIEPSQFLLTMKHALSYATLLPFPGKCGVRASITPGQTHTKFSIGEMQEKVQTGKDEIRTDEYFGFKYEMFHKDKPTDYWGCRVLQNVTKFTARAECSYKKDKTIYKLCFDRKMKFGKEHRHESYNTISMGIVDDESKCPEDPTIMIHVRRHEIEKLPNVFKTIVETCKNNDAAIPCIVEYVISQNISLDIKYHDVVPIVSDIWKQTVEQIKEQYSEYFVETDKEFTEKGSIKINLLSNWKNFNMELVSPSDKFRIENVTNEYEDMFDDADMKNYVYGLEDIDFCKVEMEHIRNANGETHQNKMSTEWSQIGAYECNCPDKWELFVKKEYLDNKAENENKDSSEEDESDNARLAFRIHSSGDNLDIHLEDKMKVYLNDKPLKEPGDTGYFDGVWFEAKSYEMSRAFVLNFKNLNKILVLDHGRQTAKIILPNEYLTNKCHATRT